MSLVGGIFALYVWVAGWKEKKLAIYTGFAWCLLGIFYLIYLEQISPNPRLKHDLGRIPLMIIPWMGLFLSRILIKEKWVSIFLKVSLISYSVVLVKSLYQFVYLKIAAFGFFNNPIYQAYSLLPAFVFFTELCLLAKDKKNKTLLYALSAILFLCISLTISRIAVICSILYFLFRILPSVYRTLGAKNIVFTFITLAALSFWIWHAELFPILNEKITRSFSGQDHSWKWRMVAWEHNWNLFLENIFLGVGIGKNGIDTAIMPQYAGHWLPNHLIFAHSIYFQALAESGIIGTLLLCLYFVFLGKESSLHRSLIFMFALSGLTENILQNSKAMHPLLFFLMLSFIVKRKDFKI